MFSHIIFTLIRFETNKEYFWNFLTFIYRVSVQGVKSLGGHFACLCRGFEFHAKYKKSKIAQIYYYDPQSAGINLPSPQSDSTPWTLTLWAEHDRHSFSFWELQKDFRSTFAWVKLRSAFFSACSKNLRDFFLYLLTFPMIYAHLPRLREYNVNLQSHTNSKFNCQSIFFLFIILFFSYFLDMKTLIPMPAHFWHLSF